MSLSWGIEACLLLLWDMKALHCKMHLLPIDIQGYSEVSDTACLPETPQSHFTLGCSLDSLTDVCFFQSVTWLPVGPWPTAQEHGLYLAWLSSNNSVVNSGEKIWSFFLFYFSLFETIVIPQSLYQFSVLGKMYSVFQDFFCIQRKPAQNWLTESLYGKWSALKQGSLDLLSPRGYSELQALLHPVAILFLPFGLLTAWFWFIITFSL